MTKLNAVLGHRKREKGLRTSKSKQGRAFWQIGAEHLALPGRAHPKKRRRGEPLELPEKGV